MAQEAAIIEKAKGGINYHFILECIGAAVVAAAALAVALYLLSYGLLILMFYFDPHCLVAAKGMSLITANVTAATSADLVASFLIVAFFAMFSLVSDNSVHRTVPAEVWGGSSGASGVDRDTHVVGGAGSSSFSMFAALPPDVDSTDQVANGSINLSAL